MIGKLDIKHGRGHKSCVSFLMEDLKREFPTWRRMQDQACEQNNPNVNRIKIKALFSRIETYQLILTLRFDIESRLKLRKFCPNGIERVARPEEKRGIGESPVWFKQCFPHGYGCDCDEKNQNNDENNINLIPNENYSDADSWDDFFSVNEMHNSDSDSQDEENEELNEIDHMLMLINSDNEKLPQAQINEDPPENVSTSALK